MKPYITEEFAHILKRATELGSSRRRDCALFVEGGAGTGKSTLNRILRDQIPNALMLAPTGVAAQQVGGSTIHRMFHFPFKVLQPEQDRKNSYPSPVLRKAKVIIVDEAGMVRADMVDGMDHYLRKATRRDQPFGGCLMLFVGDLFQLPPIVSQGDRPQWDRSGYRSEFFFDAKVWQSHPLERHSLTRVFRQADTSFAEILNRVRTGAVTDEDLDVLNSRCGIPIPDGVTELSTKRDAVEATNAKAMAALRTPLETFQGRVKGDFRVEDTQGSQDLQLKPGCLVMLLNNTDDWQNGSVGTYEGKSEGGLRVRLSTGGCVVVPKHTWERKRYKLVCTTNTVEQEVIGTFTQFPVALAHGVTIHKSQGQTLERAVIDLGTRTFAAGQAYVALSRLRSLEGLYLRRPVQREDCYAAERVLEYMSGREQKNETAQDEEQDLFATARMSV